VPSPIALSNGLVSLDVHVPDPEAGVYRGTRFDWSGVISRLEFAGHRYFGPWFTRTGDVPDFTYEGGDIVAGPASAIVGPVEEFSTNGSALGFEVAPAGGTFIKIGVGVLRRPDAGAYNRCRIYDIVDHGRWTLAASPTSATFTHEVLDPASGYAYLYEKSVSLAADEAEMRIDHRLMNSGTKTIDTDVYNHNFLVLDGLPTGTGFTIELPFRIETARPPDPALAVLEGGRIRYVRELALGERVGFPIEGFGTTAAHSRITIENTRTGAGVRIVGNRPLSRLALWSIRSTIAVEPFVRMSIDAGGEFRWQSVYTFYTLTGPSRATR
jgi:hypothetical protein